MQHINEQLPQICRENAEVITNYNSVAINSIEELEQVAKNSGSPKLIASIEKLKQVWEEGLKVSHDQTVQLYEDSADEAAKILAAL